MADLTVTAKDVGPVFPLDAKIRSRIAAEALTAGQPVYINSSGKAAKADASAAGTALFRGIVTTPGGAGQAVSVLEAGEVSGVDLSGLAYDDPVYLSTTAGALADAGDGTYDVVVGRVVPLTDKDLTKVLRVDGFAG